MLPGLTELLMAAQLTLAPATIPPTADQPATRPAVTQKALESLSLKKVNCLFADNCCTPLGCTCDGSCK